MQHVTEPPRSWKTFQGKTVDPYVIDQQHLSNVYWYGIILCGISHDWVIGILKERFNGQLFEYRPHIDFVQEIEALRKRGAILSKAQVQVESKIICQEEEIVHNGVVVGRIIAKP